MKTMKVLIPILMIMIMATSLIIASETNVSIIYPVEGTTYNSQITTLNYALEYDITPNYCWYSLDNGTTNTTFTNYYSQQEDGNSTSFVGYWNDSANVEDGSDATSGTATNGTAYYYTNYSKPTNANSNSQWRIHVNNPPDISNRSIPLDCFNQTPIQLRILSNVTNDSSTSSCWNGSEWKTIYYTGSLSNPDVYREFMWWEHYNCSNITGITSSEGVNTWAVYVNDSDNVEGSGFVTFTINTYPYCVGGVSGVVTLTKIAIVLILFGACAGIVWIGYKNNLLSLGMLITLFIIIVVSLALIGGSFDNIAQVCAP